MAIGMTYEQYWYGDPLMVRAFYEAEKLRQKRVNEEAWLYGSYVLRALDATVMNILRKGQAHEYPLEPIGTEKKRERNDEQDAVFARAYMMQMMQAGKNWGKR